MTQNTIKTSAGGAPCQTTTASAPQTSKPSLDLRIISHNIRYAVQSPSRGEEAWPTRHPRLCSQLLFNSTNPSTFICLQEALHQQVVDVHSSLNAASLSSSHESWDYIGVGRDDGKQAGEYSPVFFRSGVWKKTKGFETRWLSQTPNRPSRGWDAACVRIVTIGYFMHLETGLNVVVMNTHFDHVGVVARRESASLILREIDIITSTNPSISAIFLAGDFNSPPNDAAYKVMTSSNSAMEDIALQIPKEMRYGNELTFTGFSDRDGGSARIDFVFARKVDREKKKVDYRGYRVLANRFDDGVYLSDHRACIGDVTLTTC